MKAIITLNHGDGVSGTTIFDDGTKAFWSEGRTAYTIFIRPDGRIEESYAHDQPVHPILVLMLDDNKTEEAYGKVSRDMTVLEEHEHHMMRNMEHIFNHSWRREQR